MKPEKAALESSFESALRSYLQPVVPRDEFVNRLRGKLEEQVLPIQKKTTISFYTLLEVLIRTVAMLLLTVLTVRTMMVIISTWKILRASSAR
jgi:hypothetical protein